ncbi:MAG: acyloxyacyl hydrolase [Bacteroidia bacterium]
MKILLLNYIMTFLFCCLVHAVCLGQNGEQNPVFVLGAQTSHTFWDQPLPEGTRYKPVVRAVYAAWYLPRERNRPYAWYIMLEPQWNNVFVGDSSYRELGVLPGLGIQYRLSKQFYLFGEGGAGVKFITARTERQARGFLFTDNFIGGIRHILGKSPWEIRVHFRARHISNASLRQPNGGINNFFFGGGLYFAFH